LTLKSLTIHFQYVIETYFYEIRLSLHFFKDDKANILIGTRKKKTPHHSICIGTENSLKLYALKCMIKNPKKKKQNSNKRVINRRTGVSSEHRRRIALYVAAIIRGRVQWSRTIRPKKTTQFGSCSVAVDRYIIIRWYNIDVGVIIRPSVEIIRFRSRSTQQQQQQQFRYIFYNSLKMKKKNYTCMAHIKLWVEVVELPGLDRVVQVQLYDVKIFYYCRGL